MFYTNQKNLNFLFISALCLNLSCLGEQPSAVAPNRQDLIHPSKEVKQPDVIFGDIKPDATEAVCNPFDPNHHSNSINFTHGLKAELRSPKEEFHPKNFTDNVYGYNLDFYRNYLKVDTISTEVYFQNLNIPTRSFSEGFTKGSGELLKDNQENELTEFFSLHFKSEIALPDEAQDAEYEIAFISDDGIEASIYGELYLKHSHATSPKMTCTLHNNELRWIPFSALQKKPIEIHYFQGPKFHIALVALWRKKDLSSPQEMDPFCGKNQDYFSKIDGKTRLEYLQDRGWEIIPSNVFYLPGEAENPCGP